MRSKKTEGEKRLPLSRLSPTAPLTRGAGKPFTDFIQNDVRKRKSPAMRGIFIFDLPTMIVAVFFGQYAVLFFEMTGKITE